MYLNVDLGFVMTCVSYDSRQLDFVKYQTMKGLDTVESLSAGAKD